MKLPGLSAEGTLRPIAALTRNRITLAGAVLTTSSALTMIGFWIAELLLARAVHPYAGLILFLVLPALFVLGLLLIPIGFLWERRKRKDPLAARVDVREPRVRQALTLLAVATGVNIVLLCTASY